MVSEFRENKVGVFAFFAPVFIVFVFETFQNIDSFQTFSVSDKISRVALDTPVFLKSSVGFCAVRQDLRGFYSGAFVSIFSVFIFTLVTSIKS